jgi:sphingomyelin phosphodiesterase
MKNDPNLRKTLKVVHMSDPHIDMEYSVGANNDCGGYLCCRAVNGFPITNISKQAGNWGAYQCDLPE